MNNSLDPWDWSVDDVVSGLCHTDRLWAHDGNPRLPDLTALETTLRDNDIDGKCLLNDVTQQALKDELGVKAFGHRSTVFRGIERLRDDSFKWKNQQAKVQSRQRQISDIASATSPEPTPLQRSRPHSNFASETVNRLTPTSVAAHSHAPHVPQTPETPTRVPPEEIVVERREGGAKRRKVVPEHVTVDRPTSNVNTAQSKAAYLGRGRITASDVVFGSAICGQKPHPEIADSDDDDDDQDFAFIGSAARSQPGRSAFINQRMRHLLRAELQADGPTLMKLTPYPERLEEGRLNIISVRMIAPGRAVATKQDTILMRHADLGYGDSSLMKDVAGNADWDHLLENYPVTAGDEGLPVYRDSEGGETDAESFYQELEEDQERAEKKKPRELAFDEVTAVLDQYIDRCRQDWQTRKLPSLESKARSIWLNKGMPRKTAIDQAQKEIAHKRRYLDSMRQRILEDHWTKREAVLKQCESMELTVQRTFELDWKIQLWQQAHTPPRREKINKAPREKPKDDDGDSIVLSSEDDMTDFVEDDGPSTKPTTRIDYDNQGRRAALKSDTDMKGQPQQLHDDIDEVLDSIDSPRRASKTQQSDARSKDSVFDSDSDPENERIRRPGHTSSKVIPDIIDLTELPSSPPEAAETEPPPQTPLPDVKHSCKHDYQADDGAGLVEPSTPKAPAPSNELQSPSNVASTGPPNSKWFSDPQLATPEEIRSWDDDELIERGDRKRVLLKLLLRMDVPTFVATEERVEVLGQAKRQFKIELVRALGELRTLSGSLHDLSAKQYKGLTAIARLFVCWTDCDPTHFDEQQIHLSFVKQAQDTVTKDVHEFRPFLIHAIGMSGAASRDDELEDSQLSPKKLKKRRHAHRSGQNLRESAARRRAAGQEGEHTIKLKLQSSGLREDDYDGIIINPHDEASNFVPIMKSISDRMKPHQIDGVRFLWREVVTAGLDSTSGCLLAHTMGLGKTMQSIAFIITYAESALDARTRNLIPAGMRSESDLKLPRILVLCPPGLINNWHDEFKKWLPHHQLLNQTWKIDSTVEPLDRFFTIQVWYQQGGVLILGYEMFREITTGKRLAEKLRASTSKLDPEALVEHLQKSAHLVVADEAHKFKSPGTGIGQAMAKLESHGRIALTGSPLANSLSEYYAMINWVAPNYLGSPAEFKETFQTPIEDGTYADSSRYEQRRSMKKLEALKEELEPKVSRKDITAIRGDLKAKTEFVLRFALSDVQLEAYTLFVQSLKSNAADIVNTAKMFDWMGVLTLLLFHPAVFMQKLQQRDAQLRAATDGKAAKLSKASTPSDEEGDQDVDIDTSKLGLSESMLDKQRQLFSKLPEHYQYDMSLSPKTKFIEQVLDTAKAEGDQVLIFSHSRAVLDHLQQWLQHSRKDISSKRLDGTTPMHRRLEMAKEFNSGKFKLMLISTRAGGLGLNLPGANRVILADFSFNPSWEEQAVGRAYRLGQTKPVFVYHLLCGRTFEEPLHHRTVFKKQLSNRAVDKKNSKPVANKMHEFLFVPSTLEKEDLSSQLGIDICLDAVLKSGHVDIRSITTTDIFHQDEQPLTAQELVEVRQELDMWRLKATDPVKYEQLRREKEAREARMQQGFMQHPQSIMNPRSNNTPPQAMSSNAATSDGPKWPSITVDPEMVASFAGGKQTSTHAQPSSETPRVVQTPPSTSQKPPAQAQTSTEKKSTIQTPTSTEKKPSTQAQVPTEKKQSPGPQPTTTKERTPQTPSTAEKKTTPQPQTPMVDLTDLTDGDDEPSPQQQAGSGYGDKAAALLGAFKGAKSSRSRSRSATAQEEESPPPRQEV